MPWHQQLPTVIGVILPPHTCKYVVPCEPQHMSRAPKPEQRTTFPPNNHSGARIPRGPEATPRSMPSPAKRTPPLRPSRCHGLCRAEEGTLAGRWMRPASRGGSVAAIAIINPNFRRLLGRTGVGIAGGGMGGHQDRAGHERLTPPCLDSVPVRLRRRLEECKLEVSSSSLPA